MLKAIMFDLDDTLLWDHKSVSEAFKATCQKAEEKHKGLLKNLSIVSDLSILSGLPGLN